MTKTEIAEKLLAKTARLTALQESEHIAMMSDDFYYKNGGDSEIRRLQSEIQELTKALNAEEIPEAVILKATEMYAAYNGGTLEGSGDSVRGYWIEEAKKALG